LGSQELGITEVCGNIRQTCSAIRDKIDDAPASSYILSNAPRRQFSLTNSQHIFNRTSRLVRLEHLFNKMFHDLLLFLTTHWLWTTLLILCFYLGRNYFYHGLNKYPGPFFARFTNLWRFLDVLGRRAEVTHQALHKKHGDVVRLGPNVLSFGNPRAIKSIYGLNKGFTKVILSASYVSQTDKAKSQDFTQYNKRTAMANAFRLFFRPLMRVFMLAYVDV
jgi:hypothetical protein